MREVHRYNKRTGVHTIAITDEGEMITGMCLFKRKIIVATTKAVYFIKDKRIKECKTRKRK